jgi:hypothetical protein
MKYILRRLKRMLLGKKRRYQSRFLKYQVTYDDINAISDRIYNLENSLNGLANSVNRKKVQGIYMNEKDAKKYEGKSFVCH